MMNNGASPRGGNEGGMSQEVIDRQRPFSLQDPKAPKTPIQQGVLDELDNKGKQLVQRAGQGGQNNNYVSRGLDIINQMKALTAKHGIRQRMDDATKKKYDELGNKLADMISLGPVATPRAESLPAQERFERRSAYTTY